MPAGGKVIRPEPIGLPMMLCNIYESLGNNLKVTYVIRAVVVAIVRVQAARKYCNDLAAIF